MMPSNPGGKTTKIRRFFALSAVGAVETSLILAVMAYADHEKWFAYDIASLQPHPYWIPVLLAAAFYGRAAGLFVAGFAAGLDAALGWPHLTNHPDLYGALASTSRDAALWLVAAAVLGGVRDRQVERRRQVETALDKRTDEARVLAERCRSLMQDAAARERSIAASDAAVTGSMLQLFEAQTRQMGRNGIESFRQVLDASIGARDVTIYVPGDDGWICVAPSEDKSTELMPDAVCDAVAATDGVFSCLRPAEARLLGGHAAMATSVRGSDGSPIGVVFVGQVDPDCMTSAGEAAIALSGFILGSRVLETETLQLRGRHAHQFPRLRMVVNGDTVGA